jgi:flagellar biosynthesis/type III secretory pathway M-ring protein FliF/YscJ
VDQVRRILATIGGALGKLAPSQKLLIASLAVIVVMTLFVVSQYAAAPKMVPVLSGGTSEDAQRIAGYLETQGIEYKAVGGKILVPADKKLLFSTMQDSQDWIRSRSQLDQRYTIALSNELAQVIRNFPGVTDASVFIAPAPHGGGIGAAARKPTAQITVFTRQGSALDQPSVDALADLVAGWRRRTSRSWMEPIAAGTARTSRMTSLPAPTWSRRRRLKSGSRTRSSSICLRSSRT